MIRRTYELAERPSSGARSFLTEKGNWALEEERTISPQDIGPRRRVLIAGLSYLAASAWEGLFRGVIDAFIEDNRQTCDRCGAAWIVLRKGLGEHCPGCGAGLITQCNEVQMQKPIEVTVNYGNHQYHYEYAKSAYFCPNCGSEEVWVEQSDGDYYQGPNHVCTSCTALFTLPSGADPVEESEYRETIGTSPHSALQVILQIREATNVP
jgi:predicted RNA-binding Zn-ribbon protein involved in translation (DUF1610 family)